MEQLKRIRGWEVRAEMSQQQSTGLDAGGGGAVVGGF